jgi:hypothetical protein
MTCTVVNPHVCCNGPNPEDAHDDYRPPPHPHAETHLTNNDRLRWKTNGRPQANGPLTTTPQQRQHNPSTPARGPSRSPTPRPSSGRHLPAKAKVRSPLWNRILVCMHVPAGTCLLYIYVYICIHTQATTHTLRMRI